MGFGGRFVAGNAYHIAVIGSGPAGLSAAARAAYHDRSEGRSRPSHILLEGHDCHARTIQRYQKRKHVMAEPGFLDLRSDLEFCAGTREQVLDSWASGVDTLGVNVRYGATVRAVEGERGAFRISLADGGVVEAEHVVLAIGLEGNPRKLGVPGEDLPRLQYHLEDPDEFRGERIVVVGAGDSAIENAIALAAGNEVVIVNRRAEFSRAKDGNLAAILAAISDSDTPLSCFYESSPARVEETPDGDKPLRMVLDTPAGERSVPCDRVIARLGGIPPRRFVESVGITFPGERPDAIPELSKRYETNVPGVFIVGSLAGYPLIKQAMNQGYDVVEYIRGNDVKPVDHSLIEYQFKGLPYVHGLTDDEYVDEFLQLFQKRVPMFRELNALAFRELVIESTVHASYADDTVFEEVQRTIEALRERLEKEARKKDRKAPRITRLIREGEPIYREGEFGTSFFTIVDGEVALEGPDGRTSLGRGQFFGESSLLSGRPRAETAIAAANCVLFETPRRTMLKLMNSNESVREGIDWIFVVRELQRVFAPHASIDALRSIAERVARRSFKAGEVLFTEGERGDTLHVVRSGGVTLTREHASTPVLVAQLRSGSLVGEMALMGDPVRRETARADVACEVLEIARPEFLALMQLPSARIERLQGNAARRSVHDAVMEVRPEVGRVMDFMLDQGLGEATNVLLIDEALCIGCDNCEKACAETHEGVSRLDREAGPSYARLHVPISCRHCEQPHCMKDCPPNAIHLAPTGEVFIDDTCIGCGNCETNCPYDVIRMAYPAPPKPGLLQWLLFGRGDGPGEPDTYEPSPKAKEAGKKAMKCDACVNEPSGPACVRACPTGAAIRIGPDQFLDAASGALR